MLASKILVMIPDVDIIHRVTADDDDDDDNADDDNYGGR